jgi:hypothetical protein
MDHPSIARDGLNSPASNLVLTGRGKMIDLSS